MERGDHAVAHEERQQAVVVDLKVEVGVDVGHLGLLVPEKRRARHDGVPRALQRVAGPDPSFNGETGEKQEKKKNRKTKKRERKRDGLTEHYPPSNAILLPTSTKSRLNF